MARGEVGEVGLAGEDLVAEVEEARGGVGARGGGDDAAVGVLPGGLAAGTLVLDEDVRRPHRLPVSSRRRRHGAVRSVRCVRTRASYESPVMPDALHFTSNG